MARMTYQRFAAVERAVKEYIDAHSTAMLSALGANDLVKYYEHASEAQHAAAGMAVLKERFHKQASQLEAAQT